MNGLIRSLRVEPGKPAGLADRDPGDRLGFESKECGPRAAGRADRADRHAARPARRRSARSLLLVLQGLDASGKDGTVRHVLTGVNPQAWRIVSFKAADVRRAGPRLPLARPSRLPRARRAGIFNRSHYEDLVAARVRGLVPEHVWKRRPRQVREFERTSGRGGHGDRQGLPARLGRRAARRGSRSGSTIPRRPGSSASRISLTASAEATTSRPTRTPSPRRRLDWAPWHVVPADHNWVRNLAVAELLAHALQELDPQLPPADPALAELHIL